MIWSSFNKLISHKQEVIYFWEIQKNSNLPGEDHAKTQPSPNEPRLAANKGDFEIKLLGSGKRIGTHLHLKISRRIRSYVDKCMTTWIIPFCRPTYAKYRWWKNSFYGPWFWWWVRLPSTLTTLAWKDNRKVRKQEIGICM